MINDRVDDVDVAGDAGWASPFERSDMLCSLHETYKTIKVGIRWARKIFQVGVCKQNTWNEIRINTVEMSADEAADQILAWMREHDWFDV